jgi:hypothetical protein
VCGRFDFEAMEGFVRDKVLHCGAIIVSHLLWCQDEPDLPQTCRCGGMWRAIKRCDKTFLTLLVEVRIRRHIQRCDGCGAWRAAEDELLDMVHTGFSPGVRRIMERTGEEMPFDKARIVMWELARVRATAKDVERKGEQIGAHIHQLSEEQRREVFSGVAEDGAAVVGEDGSEAPEVLYIAADGTGVPVVKPET